MSFIFESANGVNPSYEQLYANNLNDCNANCPKGKGCYHPNPNSSWMKKGVCADDKYANHASATGYKGQHSNLEFSKYTPYTYDPQWEETHFNYPCQGPARVNGLWFKHTVRPFKQCVKGCKCKICAFKRVYV